MSRLVPAAVVLSGLLLACDRGAPRIASIHAWPGAQEDALRAAGLDRSVLEAAAREGLAGAGFRIGDGKRSYRARLEVVAARRRMVDGGAVAELAVDLELILVRAPDEATPVLETGVGEARIAPAATREAWRQALAAAVREAATGLSIALSEESKPVARLLADLRADDPRVREQAIRVLGDRRAGEAVPALVDRLRDPEPMLAERAAGALAQIRDPRAVGPLIDYSRKGDDARIARFARIVGDIGGSEARGYLEILESGDLDPGVRSAAREALQDLDEREREQGRLSDRGGPAAGGGASRESPPADSGRMER